MPVHNQGYYYRNENNRYWLLWSDDRDFATCRPAEKIIDIVEGVNDRDEDGRDLLDALQAGELD